MNKLNVKATPHRKLWVKKPHQGPAIGCELCGCVALRINHRTGVPSSRHYAYCTCGHRADKHVDGPFRGDGLECRFCGYVIHNSAVHGLGICLD